MAPTPAHQPNATETSPLNSAAMPVGFRMDLPERGLERERFDQGPIPFPARQVAIPQNFSVVKELNPEGEIIGLHLDHPVRQGLSVAHDAISKFINTDLRSNRRFGFAAAASGDSPSLRPIQSSLADTQRELERFALTRSDGTAPTLIVRQVASQGAELLEHEVIALRGADLDTIAHGDVPAILDSFVQLKGRLRGLMQAFDSSIQFTPAGVEAFELEVSEGEGERAA